MNTMQQEFDAVVAHLYKQGRRSTAVGLGCLYRSPNGDSCAVGCRIPDDSYDEGMDKGTYGNGTDVVSLLNSSYGNLLPAEIKEYSGMFTELQYAHDRCMTEEGERFDLQDLTKRLASVAAIYNLTFTPPETIG